MDVETPAPSHPHRAASGTWRPPDPHTEPYSDRPPQTPSTSRGLPSQHNNAPPTIGGRRHGELCCSPKSFYPHLLNADGHGQILFHLHEYAPGEHFKPTDRLRYRNATDAWARCR